MSTIGTKEAAKRLGLKQKTVERMCREGRIKGAEHDCAGSPWHIPEYAIDEILERRKNKL